MDHVFLNDSNYEIIEGDLLYLINGGAEEGSTGANLTDQGYSSSTAGFGQGYLYNATDFGYTYEIGYAVNNQGAFYCGHSLSYVGKIGGAYTVYEVKGLKNNDKVGKQFEDIKGSLILSKNKIESPAQWVLGLFGKDKNAGAIMYNFESKSEMDNFF